MVCLQVMVNRSKGTDGVAYEQVLYDRQGVRQVHSRVAQGSEPRPSAAEKVVQGMRRRLHQQGFLPPLPLIATQNFYPILNGGELAILFSFTYLYLAAAGGGAWSVDRMLGKD